MDTAGSDFDTIVGVYTFDGDTYNQVGCVDDVDTPEGGSLQAAITFGTDPGATYYVQVGGFGGATGRLQLTVS